MAEEQTNVFEGVLPKVMQTIRASNALAAQDVNFYKSLDAGLSQDIDEQGTRILDVVNSMLQMSASTTSSETRPIEFGKEYMSSDISWKPVSNALDNIFERIDIMFDECEKGSKRSRQNENKMTFLEDGVNDSANSNNGKKMVKPQLNFGTKIDNSESHPFKPKLTEKPHALKGLDEVNNLIDAKTVTNEETGEQLVDPAHYMQPYEYEIDNQPYPESILHKTDPIPSKDWQSTSALWVDTPESLQSMIEQLSGSSEIAVDLEHHDYRSYYGLVCLMQISNRDQDWIVDTLALRDQLQPLNVIFTDPQIVKVFHGAFMDIIWLQRDLGLYIVSLFDTYHASKKLGFPKFSLAYLLETFANFKTSKKYQLSDWRIRPLSSAMMAYARSDTHFLLNIFDQLRNKLIDQAEKGNGENTLQQVLYESRQVAKRRFEYTRFRPLKDNLVTSPVMSSNRNEPYASILYQYNVPLEKKPLIARLYEWRDNKARQLDESPRFVMSNQVMVSLAALSPPIDVSKVLGCSSFIGEVVRVNAGEISKILEETISQLQELDKNWQAVHSGASKKDEGDDEININRIAFTTAVFDKLVNAGNLSGEGDQLLKSQSRVLSQVYHTGENEFSIEYDGEGNVIHHKDDEYWTRLQFALEQFDKLNEAQQQAEAKSIDNDELDRDTDENVSQSAEQEKPSISDDEIDSNEVITLRKKRQGKQKQQPQPLESAQDEEEQSQSPSAFDYANADKIMIDMNDRRRQKREDQKNKKRSFDPYTRDNSGGPQGSKRAKKMNSGKTSTFSNKKRR